ncbi:mutator type transposase [Tanacetum coccineum]
MKRPTLTYTHTPKPKRLVIEELDDAELIISKAWITPVAKKLVLDVNDSQSSGKEKGQSSRKDIEGKSSAVGNDGSSQVPSQFVNDFYSSYDPYEESQDPNFDPFADLDLILPTNRNREGNTSYNVDLEDTTNDVEKEGEKERQDEEESKDDVDVDMEDFEYNIDEELEFMGCRDREQPLDIEEGDAEEIEVLDNDYFESASDSDDEGSRLRKRKLKQIRKQAHASEQIYKTYFYVEKEFPNKEDVKSYIKEHSIETKREIRMEKNDNERVRAVCRGVIPSLPSFKDLGNGPSQGSGPSQSSGPSQGSGPSQASRLTEKWTKEKIARSNGYRSPSKGKLTKEKLINGGKPNSKKQVDDNKCPWVLLVSKIKNTETWQVKTYKSVHKCLQSRTNLYATYHWFAKELVEQLKTNPKIPVRAVQEQLQQKHELSVTQSKAFRAKQEDEWKLRSDYTLQYKMLRDYVLELQESNPNTTVKIHVQSEADHEVPTRVFKRIYVCLGPLKAGFKAGIRDLLGLDGEFMKENTKSWTWFLTQLGDDLDLYRNLNFTFVSDRQKGIIPAIGNLFPNAEHRYCRTAKSTTVPDFQFAMEKLKEFSNEAYEWLNLISPQHWSRSHLSWPKSDVLLNNMCEVFNGKLVGGRDKPIIVTLEFAMEYLMKRIVNVNKLIDRCDGPLTPTATKILKQTQMKLGSTLKWELTGIPCKHVVATNWVMSLNNRAGIPEEWVHPCYSMDDPNITMEEYIRLEEEKAQKRGKVFNWEIAKYGKIWYDEDIHDLRSVDTEFPAISFIDEVSSKILSREPTVSSLNDEIDIRVSFDDSDDEDYTNDALTSKSDLLTKPILNPRHIDEFDLNDETSLFEYDEEEQNVLYLNDIFPFIIICPDDLKSEKDNDDNDIDIIQSLEGNEITPGSNAKVQSSLCPICNVLQEDTSHLFFSCDVALAISQLIRRWWNVYWIPVDSYSGWLEWFNSIRLGSKLKGILEGVFYVSWWCLWNFRNQLLFASKKPRKETLFDDVVSRSFIWSNSRCNLKFTWDCWLQHPYLIAL